MMERETSLLSRLLIKSASFVLASFRSSTYPRGYVSGLHSLRPCWTAFLNSLQERSSHQPDQMRQDAPFPMRRSRIALAHRET